MDFLDFDKLNKQVSVCESIADNVIDDTSYNAVTQRANNALTEATADYNEVIRKGHDINDVLDFADLEKTINSALLGINESVESDNKEIEMKNKKSQSVVESIESIDDFLNAAPIKQTDFVKEKTGSKVSEKLQDANTNTEHNVTEHKSDEAVEKQADGTMKQMQKTAEGNKEWEANSKTQVPADAKAILKENADKYVAFVESLRNVDNSRLIDGVIKAFNVIR